jgi:hypothetical protein
MPRVFPSGSSRRCAGRHARAAQHGRAQHLLSGYRAGGIAALHRQNRDIARRMVKSYIEAIHIVRTNPELSKRAFVKYRKTKDEKQSEDAYQTLREVVKAKPYPNPEAFKTIFKDLSDRIPAANSANAKEFMDTSFLEELDKSGYIDGLYR